MARCPLERCPVGRCPVGRALKLLRRFLLLLLPLTLLLLTRGRRWEVRISRGLRHRSQPALVAAFRVPCASDLKRRSGGHRAAGWRFCVRFFFGGASA